VEPQRRRHLGTRRNNLAPSTARCRSQHLHCVHRDA
jgi:hypothetical protein